MTHNFHEICGGPVNLATVGGSRQLCARFPAANCMSSAGPAAGQGFTQQSLRFSLVRLKLQALLQNLSRQYPAKSCRQSHCVRSVLSDGHTSEGRQGPPVGRARPALQLRAGCLASCGCPEEGPLSLSSWCRLTLLAAECTCRLLARKLSELSSHRNLLRGLIQTLIGSCKRVFIPSRG